MKWRKFVKDWLLCSALLMVGAAVLWWSWVYTFVQLEKWHDRQHAEGQDD